MNQPGQRNDQSVFKFGVEWSEVECPEKPIGPLGKPTEFSEWKLWLIAKKVLTCEVGSRNLVRFP